MRTEEVFNPWGLTPSFRYNNINTSSCSSSNSSSQKGSKKVVVKREGGRRGGEVREETNNNNNNNNGGSGAPGGLEQRISYPWLPPRPPNLLRGEEKETPFDRHVAGLHLEAPRAKLRVVGSV